MSPQAGAGPMAFEAATQCNKLALDAPSSNLASSSSIASLQASSGDAAANEATAKPRHAGSTGLCFRAKAWVKIGASAHASSPSINKSVKPVSTGKQLMPWTYSGFEPNHVVATAPPPATPPATRLTAKAGSYTSDCG